MGGNKHHSYGSYGAGGAYGCMPGGQWSGGSQYAHQGQYGMQGNGCGPAGGYAVAHNAYGASGMAGYGAGAGGYSAGTGAYGPGMHGTHGLRGAQNTGGYGYNAPGAGTMLGANTPYGSAVGGQYAGGGASSYQTVQGAPIYVQQPYPAHYGMNAGGGCGYAMVPCGGAALPFGIEAGVGTDFNIDGDVFPGEVAKPFLGGPGTVSDLAAVSYKDAYNEAVHYDLAATYDLDPRTTILGRIGYSEADGQNLLVGTVDDGAGTTEDLYAQFGDLEQVTLEGGVRRYMGGWNNSFSGVRPYVGATAGFTHNSSVDLTQSSATLVDPTLFTQEYIDAGWTPTASGVLGAEMQVGPRTALGVETGIRWSDDLDTNFDTGDRWSVPVRLRGRVSF